MTIEKLKRRAEKAAKARDHKLSKWLDSQDHTVSLAYCTIRNCHDCWVQIMVNPEPNQIDIGGPAIAVECPQKRK